MSDTISLTDLDPRREDIPFHVEVHLLLQNN